MFETHLKHIEMRKTLKYKHGKLVTRVKKEDDVPERDEGCFKHRQV